MRRAFLRPLALAALTALPCAGAEKAGAWEYAARKNDRHFAFVSLHGTGPTGPCDATLVLSRVGEAARKPVTNNNVTTPPLIIELWLTNSKQAAPFDFNDYEGPDAVGGAVTVTLTNKGKPVKRKWRASGWFSPLRDPTGGSEAHRQESEAEAFVFGLGDVTKGYRDLLQVADGLAAGADALTIDIAGAKKSAPHLRFEVPLAGAADAVKQLLAAKR